MPRSKKGPPAARPSPRLTALARAAADLFDNAPCGFHSLDRDGVIVAINNTELAWLGYERSDLVGKTRFRDLLTPDSQRVVDTNFPIFLDRGWLKDLELDVRRRDGSVLTVLLSATAIYDATRRFVATRSVLTDITARKEAERDRDRYFILAADLFCVASSDGYFKRLNPAFTATLGWTVDELLSRPFLEFVHPDDRAATEREVERQVRDGERVLHFVNRYRHKDGSWRWLSWTSMPQPGGLMFGSARDVTELRTAEERTAALLKDLHDIKTALDEHAIVTLTDPQGRITYANRKFSATFEYSPEELVGKNHRLVNSGLHTREFFTDLWQTIRGGRVWKGEIRNRAKSGRVGWFDTTIVPFLAADGTPAQFVSIQTDITARKHAEDDVRRFNSELEAAIEARTAELQHALSALRREKIFSDTVIHSVSGFFYVIDQAGHFVRWNQTAHDVFGLSDEQMRTTAAFSLIHEPDLGLAAEKLGEAFSQGHAETELRLLTTDGPRDALLSARRMDVDGVPYLVGTGVDITARKAMEEALVESQQKILALNADLERRIAERTAELERAREAADAANRAKSAFLANMSHEIRTPLNAIAGMVELLEHTHEPDDRAKMLRVTQESAKALAEIIDDILDLSKIEAGALQVSFEPMSLQAVVSAVVELFASSASAKNLYLRATLDPRLPAAVQCDSLRLRQILFNLVGNAIKFTPAGGIQIDATLVENLPGAACVRIDVTDTGIGIAAEAQAKIFEPFVQGDVHTTRRFGGTGLGLAISQRLAGLLGGGLTIQSEPGRGTTVTVMLTLALADAAQLPAADVPPGMPSARAAGEPSGGPERKLLVVDDSAINRQVLLRQLSALGYQADEAADGRQAFDLWRSGTYAMLIADCHMPEMDGYELARSIRSTEAADPARGRLPIVGYTANAGKDSRDLCLAAGMDDALIKPVALHTLGTKVVQWLQEDRVRGSITTPAPVARDGAGTADPLDPRALLEITGGDEQFAREMLDAFVAEKAADFARLAAVLATDDLGAIVQVAHRLKGAARIVAAEPLAALCQRIESAAAAGDRNLTIAFGRPLMAEFDRVAAHVAAGAAFP
jgi:PAS domain S-box-containing protein